jgi:hypothetical protein
MLPEQDGLGNPLQNPAQVAHKLLHEQGVTDGSFHTSNQTGYWKTDKPEPHQTLTLIAEDHPANDSAVKQVAKQMAKLTNQWGIFMYKENKDGPQSQVIDNPDYQENAPAELSWGFQDGGSGI